MQKLILLLTLVLFSAGCETFKPIPGKEVSVDSLEVRVLTIAGPRDTYSFGQFTYSPKDIGSALWIINIEYAGSGNVDPMGASLEGSTPDDGGKESLNRPVRADSCCYSDSFLGGQNPFKNLADAVGRLSSGKGLLPDSPFPVGKAPERRSLVFLFPRNKIPEKLKLFSDRKSTEPTGEISLQKEQ